MADSYLDTFSALASPRISFNPPRFLPHNEILYVDSVIVNIHFVFLSENFGVGTRKRVNVLECRDLGCVGVVNRVCNLKWR